MLTHGARIFVAACLILGLVNVVSPTDTGPSFHAWRDMISPDGEIQMPEVDFRKDWATLGTWSIVDDDGRVTDQHVVYSQPGTVAAFRETGKFPDGAVLIKELLSTDSEYLTTGNAAWATEVSGWFVMIKDTEGRFPDNPLWGNGWGWAYFESANAKQTTTESFRDGCLGCHIPAKDTDWIYEHAYPVLKN